MKRFEPIATVKGTCVVLPQDHVDTDQIIPARFLYRSRKEGFAGLLFHDYFADGAPDAEAYRSKSSEDKILLAGENFGCGSSREHAVWALLDNGFRAVIAKSFGDIFYGNAMNNGLLLVSLDSSWQQLKMDVDSCADVMIDLPKQQIRCATPRTYDFHIDPFFKNMLTQGVQEIDMTLSLNDKITAFERRHAARSPWLQHPTHTISNKEINP